MEIAIKEQNYRILKLDPFAQFHIARRLAPAMWALGSGVTEALKTGDTSAIGLDVVGSLVDVISRMTNDDSQFVLNTCLSAVHRQQGAGWAKVFVADGIPLAFQDIDLPVMLQLVAAVVKENLGNFLDALPTTPPATAPE